MKKRLKYRKKYFLGGLSTAMSVASSAIPAITGIVNKITDNQKLRKNPNYFSKFDDTFGSQISSGDLFGQPVNSIEQLKNGGYPKFAFSGAPTNNTVPINAEGDETELDMSKGALLNINGLDHSEGGVDMDSKEGNYIFSKTLGFDKDGNVTINENEVKIPFSVASKKLDSKYKGNNTSITKGSKDLEFKMLIEKAELARMMKEESMARNGRNPSTGDTMKYGGRPKFANSGFANGFAGYSSSMPTKGISNLDLEFKMLIEKAELARMMKEESMVKTGYSSSMPTKGISNLDLWNKNDTKRFQNWVVGAKNDPKILGKFGIDGDMGPNTRKAYTKYGSEFDDYWEKVRHIETLPDYTKDFQEFVSGYRNDPSILGNHGANKDGVDGTWGTDTRKATYKYLNDYVGASKNRFEASKIPLETNGTPKQSFQIPQPRPSIDGISKRPEPPSVVGKGKGESGMTPGDKAQLASMVPATIYNFIKGAQKQDTVRPEYNPYENRSMSTMSNRFYDPVPEVNQNIASRNVLNESIQNNSTSFGQKLSQLQKGYANSMLNNQQIFSNKNNFDNQYRGQEATLGYQFGESRKNANILAEDLNARTKVAGENFTRAGVEQVGQGLNRFGVAKNSGLYNNTVMASLAEQYPDFDWGTFSEFLEGKGVQYTR